MRTRILPVGALAALAAFTPACLSSQTVMRTGKVNVSTDPPGSYVSRTDDEGTVVVGQAPIQAEYKYKVEVKSFPFAVGWVTSVLGWAATAVGGYMLVQGINAASGSKCDGCVQKMVTGGVTLGLGIGLGASMTAVTLSQYDQVGEFPSKNPIKFMASAEGRQSQELVVNPTEPGRPLAFVLPPSLNEGMAVRSTSGPTFRTNPLGTGGMHFMKGSPQPTAYALVVGVERYRDLSPPVGARSDAQRFAQLAAITLGVPERNVKVLLDDRATRADVEKALAWLKTNVPTGGRIYFYFAGHGAPDTQSGDPYLVPYDGDPSYLQGSAIPMSSVMATLNGTAAKEVVAIIDSCFSGSGDRSVLPAGTRPLVPVKAIDSTGSRVAVFSAAGSTEISGAAKSGGGGLFTSHVLEGLGAGRADANADGQITLTELAAYVTPRVASEARRENRQQHPVLARAAAPDTDDLVVAFGVAP
jgi:hypothetical protein